MRIPVIALLLTACAEHGQTPPVEPVEPVTLEATFQPQICTAGEPGDPTCGVNGFGLGDRFVPSGTFTLRVAAGRFEIPDLTLFPGELGWLITHVQVTINEQAWEMETDLQLANSSIALPLVTIPAEAATTISLRFETLPLP